MFLLICQSNVGKNNPQDESVAQENAEATSENNASSNRSSSHMARGQRKNELIKKRSDSQVSLSSSVYKQRRVISFCIFNKFFNKIFFDR